MVTEVFELLHLPSSESNANVHIRLLCFRSMDLRALLVRASHTGVLNTDIISLTFRYLLPFQKANNVDFDGTVYHHSCYTTLSLKNQLVLFPF